MVTVMGGGALVVVVPHMHLRHVPFLRLKSCERSLAVWWMFNGHRPSRKCRVFLCHPGPSHAVLALHEAIASTLCVHWVAHMTKGQAAHVRCL